MAEDKKPRNDRGRMQDLVQEIRAEMREWPDDLRVRLTSELAKRSFAGVLESVDPKGQGSPSAEEL